MVRGKDTIWELVRAGAETLPEPFDAASLIDFVRRRRPDVAESSIRTHINYALVESTRNGPWASRTPFLERVDRGLYRRHCPAGTADKSSDDASAEAPRPTPVVRAMSVRSSGGRVLLVGCSRTKAPSAAPAGELFRGPLFGRARECAVRSGDPWFVLSAKFGLLEPGELVTPYDVYLADRPPSYRAAWGAWVVAQLAELVPLAGLTVEVHAGEAYCAPLRDPLRAAGASLAEPLAGLRYGERLAWPGYAGASTAVEPPSAALEALLDPTDALTPGELLLRGSDGLIVPGLYTWWIDDAGAADLSRGLGHPISAGLLYAGKAGGQRREASPSTATLWGRIVGNHLRGNVRASTFRQSLAAILDAGGLPATEESLTRWMLAHLRVAAVPVAAEDVARLEDELVRRAQPPLNLVGLPPNEARSALSRLRGLFRGAGERPAADRTVSDQTETKPAEAGPELAQAFERRLRSDLDQILKTGYRPTVFQRMLAEHGAVQTTRRLLAATQLSDGFRHLWEHRLLHLSVENAVLDPRFDSLFSDAERQVARDRLTGAGFDPSA